MEQDVVCWQEGAEIEAKDTKGWTALFHATYSGHHNMVKFLLENGAIVDAMYAFLYFFAYHLFLCTLALMSCFMTILDDV